MKNTIICGLLVFSAVVYSQNDYKPINLGNSINSKYDELRPLISPDGKTLYFIRANHPQNTYENLNTEEAKKQKGSQDIWCSNLDKDNNWSEPKHLDKPFNQRRNNTVFSITPDGNTMLVRGVYENGVFVQDGFSLSQKEANGWGPFQKLDIPDFDILCLGNYYGGYLSNDNEVLVMYFSEIEGEDNSDIYVSLKKKDGTWSAPKKLKNGISSKSDEIAPILAPDGKTLYFASDRQGGFGSYDIYKTERLDDTYEKWSEPVNLGPTINSTESEKYYSIDASGNFAFMITSKNSAGGSDIVKIKLKEENKPKPVALVSGKVINKKTNLPMHATIHYELLADGKEIGNAHSDATTGEYKIVLPCGKNYGFHASEPGFIAISDNLDLSAINEYQEITRDLYLVPIEVGQVVRLNNIFYDLAKSSLREESYPELDRVVEFMNENPQVIIEVSGHTDNTGTVDFNNLLSTNRALKVKEYLVSKGVKTERIKTKGYGSSKPVAPNTTDEGKQLNRRVEFTILKK